MRENRVVLLTGDGKGKSSSALGMVLRAVGHNLRVCIVHFIKGASESAEEHSLRLLPGVERLVCGLGFVTTRSGAVYAEHVAAARRGLELAAARLQDHTCDFVVLDEVCGAVALGLLTAQEVCAAVRSATVGKIIIMTGRAAHPDLVAIADTVSEIKSIKHAYERGWPAQAGVEW